MLKKSQSKLKKKKTVHFNEDQINKNKHTLSKSFEKNKNKINSTKSISTIQTDMTSRISTSSTTKKTSLEDFTLIQLLGSGSYAKVVLAKHNLNGKLYAMKKINKSMLNNYEKQHEAHIEKQCLAELKHNNILKLNKTFQDKKNLYFVLEYCSNKDLNCLIRNLGKFDFKLAQFYSAQILSAISYMHKQGIYHRDLKPENIGLDKYMQIKIFDFATSVKINKYFDKKTMRFIDLNDEEKNYITDLIQKNEIGEDNIVKINKYDILLLSRLFVGTPEYISPEALECKYDIIGPSVDIWAFGVMLYLFFMGKTPFKGKTEKETLNNIKDIKYDFENSDNINIPEEAKDLISKIFIKDPSKRIGYNSYDYTEIKNHPFFKGINFDNIKNEQPPISNDIKEILDKFGYNIEKIYTEEEIEINLIKELYNEDKKEQEKEEEIINIKSISNKEIGININVLKKELIGNAHEYKEKDIIKNEIKEEEEDKILLEEKLQKKSPWFHYNTRIVTFYSKGYINYFEPSSKKLKGTFPINAKCRANLIDEYRFEIHTPNRNYFFKNKTKKVANEWVDTINKFIDNLSKKNEE